MKMFYSLDYIGDPRWEWCSEIHKQTLRLPNPFMDILYQYYDQIGLKNYDYAIECGTHNANTSTFLAEHFKLVNTIEKYWKNNPYGEKDFTPLYSSYRIKYPNLFFYEGDSADILKEIFMSNPNRKYFILLDSHNPGSTTPLENELKTINQFSKNKEHILLIDDVSHISGGIDRCKQLILDINLNYNILNTKIGNDIHLIYV